MAIKTSSDIGGAINSCLSTNRLEPAVADFHEAAWESVEPKVALRSKARMFRQATDSATDATVQKSYFNPNCMVRAR
jgi:hypothetical protein